MTSIPLKDGRVLETEILECPLSPDRQREVTELLQTQWPQGDLRREEALAGDYADTLRIVVVLGRENNRCIGTATVAFPVRAAELGVICDVMTLAEHRRSGIAGNVTQVAIEQFERHSPGPLYLGTLREGDAWRVYQRLGFEWYHGGVMRRVTESAAAFDDSYFAPGQTTCVRPAQWADLPGVSALLTRPYPLVAGNLEHEIYSPRWAPQNRCVSIFPTIYYDVSARGGACHVLVGERAHRILGLASIAPIDDPHQRHTGVLEITTHESHSDHGPALLKATLDAGRARGIGRVIARVPVPDRLKADWFRKLSARPAGRSPGSPQLQKIGVEVETFEFGDEPLVHS